MFDVHPLRPAEPGELEQALAHALQFDGRKSFRFSGRWMLKMIVWKRQ